MTMVYTARCSPLPDAQYIDETSASVLAEIQYEGQTRQSWGSAQCEKFGHQALEAATRHAMTACLEMFPELHLALHSKGKSREPYGGSTGTSSVGASRSGSRQMSAESSFRRMGRDLNSQFPDGSPPRDVHNNDSGRRLRASDESDKAWERELLHAVSQRIKKQEKIGRMGQGSFRAIPRNGVGSFQAATPREARGVEGAAGPVKSSKDGAASNVLEPGTAMQGVDERPRVMVVDDEPVNCKMVDVALRRAGMNVMVCNDGTEAVDAMQQIANGKQKVDVIFMDMKMRTMHGDEAATKVRYIEAEAGIPATPIIALSGGGLGAMGTKDTDVVWKSGMQGLLLKPLNMRSFPATVAQCIFHFSDGLATVDVSDRLENPSKYRESLVGDATILEEA